MQIRDSNRAMIMAASLQHHCEVSDFGITRDDEEGLEKIMNTVISAGVDILLTSGGVSMGDKDFVKPLFHKRGTVHFSKVDRLCSHSVLVLFFFFFTSSLYDSFWNYVHCDVLN